MGLDFFGPTSVKNDKLARCLMSIQRVGATTTTTPKRRTTSPRCTTTGRSLRTTTSRRCAHHQIFCPQIGGPCFWRFTHRILGSNWREINKVYFKAQHYISGFYWTLVGILPKCYSPPPLLNPHSSPLQPHFLELCCYVALSFLWICANLPACPPLGPYGGGAFFVTRVAVGEKPQGGTIQISK